ncbi:hypothetical protein TWF281_008135 [Arthrobotrys megalospora]
MQQDERDEAKEKTAIAKDKTGLARGVQLNELNEGEVERVREQVKVDGRERERRRRAAHASQRDQNARRMYLSRLNLFTDEEGTPEQLTDERQTLQRIKTQRLKTQRQKEKSVWGSPGPKGKPNLKTLARCTESQQKPDRLLSCQVSSK